MSRKCVSLVEGGMLLKLQLHLQAKLKQIGCNLLRKSVENRKRYATQLILVRDTANECE